MIIGIDLGTTNSLVGVWQAGEAVLIPNSFGEYLTPSVVSVDKDGQILIGKIAKERLISHPNQTAHAFKRFIGSQKTYQLGNQRFSPEELSALVLKSLKADAENFLGEPVHEVVITVPAYFNDTQRQATKNAAQLAGLTVKRLLNEPTAAAMAYGLHHANDEEKFLVLDLGGGTFDVTLLELFSGVMEVRSSAGDNVLGGEDFTQVLINGFIQHQNSKQNTTNEFWHTHQALLYDQAENLKKQLSTATSGNMSLTIDEKTYDWHIDIEQFTELCEPLLARFKAPIERAVRDAKIRVKELDKIILVGGATRMSVFRNLTARLFKRFPSINLNPDETIAIGAVIQAGLVAEDIALDEMILTDVAPYSLGVDTSLQIGENHYQHGVFSPIIERNTIIPTSKVKNYSPFHDDQTEVVFNIYQGEARLVADNIKLGEIRIPVPKKYQGNASKLSIDVRFSYDVNGLLEVDVNFADNTQSISIQNGAKQLTEEELQHSKDKLSALKIHPRDEAKNRHLLARAERLYAQRLGFDRERLNHLIGWYENILDSQDLDKIRHANVEMLNKLDEIENHDDYF